MDAKLYRFRQKALLGNLTPADYKLLHKKLEVTKKEAQQGNAMNERGKEVSKFDLYAKVKSFAMFISQILFVNNSIKEGLLELIPDSSKNEVLGKLSDCIKSFSEKNKTPQEKSLNKGEVEFYATLFTLQAAFDKIFVPDEEIVHYRVKTRQHTGEYEINHSYESATSYLNLANRRCIDASKEEYDLCYNITTGWSKGIDLATWNALNKYYYNEKSPTTKRHNLFASNYDIILERMLPQFAYSKLKCAEEILKQEYKRYKKEPLNVVEIGAGSGAFAIDLFMACLRLGIDTTKVRYLGLEPNKKMRGKFKENAKQKTGVSTLPKGWQLVPGDLESFTANPSNYSDNDKAIIVLCYCAHHCFNKSIREFFTSEKIKDNARSIYVLDVVKEHGWTKPYYMWADCESPENFDNVVQNGIWNSQTLWQEPNLPIEGYALTNAWCNLRKLTVERSNDRKPDLKESYIPLNDGEHIFLRHNSLKEDKKTLLFVHGLGESGLCFQEVFDDPRFDEFNLLVPDMIGYGRSSNASDSNYKFDLQVNRLWQLVEHINRHIHIDELILIGHSLGGDLTTLFCDNYLDEKIIKKYVNIEGDITPYDLFISTKVVKAYDKVGDTGFDTWLREEFANNVYYDYAEKYGESLQRYYASLNFCRPEAFLQNAIELYKRNRNSSNKYIQSEIGEIYILLSEKIPTIFCYGTESLNTRTICFLKENNLEYEAFEGAGHWLMIDKKEEFYDFLYNFVI